MNLNDLIAQIEFAALNKLQLTPDTLTVIARHLMELRVWRAEHRKQQMRILKR